MMQQLAPPAPPPLRHQRDASSRQQPRQGFSSSRQQHNITRRRQAWRDAHGSSNGSSGRDGIAQHQQGVVLPQLPQPPPQQQLQQQPWQQPQQPQQPLLQLQQVQHSSNGYVSASLQVCCCCWRASVDKQCVGFRPDHHAAVVSSCLVC